MDFKVFGIKLSFHLDKKNTICIFHIQPFCILRKEKKCNRSLQARFKNLILILIYKLMEKINVI